MYNHRINIKKLDHKFIKIVFLGYSLTQEGYKYLDPIIGPWYVSRDVKFVEYVLYFPWNSPQEKKSHDSGEKYFKE